jgi:hypothetical protein
MDIGAWKAPEWFAEGHAGTLTPPNAEVRRGPGQGPCVSPSAERRPLRIWTRLWTTGFRSPGCLVIDNFFNIPGIPLIAQGGNIGGWRL